VFHDRRAVFLDHLARHDALDAGIGERVDKAGAGTLQLELHGVSVEHLDAFDRRVVFEFAGFDRALVHFLEPGDAFLQHARELLALGDRVEEPLVCESDVVRRELALLAAEGGVVGEVDTSPQLDNVGAEVRRNLGHAFGKHRDDLRGTREIVVAVQRFEDVRRDDA
jgi:hypothetical protein